MGTKAPWFLTFTFNHFRCILLKKHRMKWSIQFVLQYNRGIIISIIYVLKKFLVPKIPIYIYIYIVVCDRRALLLSHDCSTLALIRTLYCWVLSKEVSNTIIEVFGMTWHVIEPRSSEPLANAPPWGLSSLAKELPAAASVMRSSSKELSTLVANRV